MEDLIRKKLKKYLQVNDSILLEILYDSPEEGSSWIEIQVKELAKLLLDPNFDREKTGLDKYLNKWYEEGLISAEEKNTGKFKE